MSEQEQLELLRSLLARAYEKRQPLPLRLINTIKKHIVPRTEEDEMDFVGSPFITFSTECNRFTKKGDKTKNEQY